MPRTTSTINTRIKLGADPEFVWFNGTQFVNASNVTTSHRATTAELGVDGACNTGEMRPKPGTPMHVWHGINRILTEAARFPYDMYAGSGRNVPTGGHIHFSGIQHTAELLQKLDKFITVPLNEVSDRSARRYYGQLSEVRSQPHGWEYRSPCSWIVHPVIAKGVLRIAWVLALATEMGRLSEINEVEDIIRFGDGISENHICQNGTIQNFYKMLKRMKRHNIKLEQVEVFQAWKKKERRGTGTSTIRTFVPTVHFSNDDFNMETVKREFFLTCSVEVSANHSVSVVGASVTRTAEKIVYVPTGYDTLAVNPEPGVRNEEWDRTCFGLSYSLREEPDVAARALYNVLKREETVASTNGNAAILNTIEGRRS
jgi:hypothetical protein